MAMRTRSLIEENTARRGQERKRRKPTHTHRLTDSHTRLLQENKARGWSPRNDQNHPPMRLRNPGRTPTTLPPVRILQEKAIKSLYKNVSTQPNIRKVAYSEGVLCPYSSLTKKTEGTLSSKPNGGPGHVFDLKYTDFFREV